jgi:3-hydroxy-9,10-secoandrosta-1,3,5(10)-triene-9,17-dione monooxygenase
MAADGARVNAELVERAVTLRPKLVARAAETERLTYYPPETHEDFLEAGFYRMFVPKRYGGLEVDLPTFLKVIIEVAHGDMSTAWCLCLASAHALNIASLFEEQAQEEIFGDGDFRSPAVAAPAGTATRTDDGWEISGTWAYCSGAPYATHYVGQTFVAPAEESGPPGPILLFCVPRAEWTMLDDWGQTLGLKGSGSHSITMERARVPAHYVLENQWLVDVAEGSPGLRIHGNPMYAGRNLALFQAELASLAIGGVKGSLDEYERLIRERKTQRPPIVPRYLDPDYQRWFGLAISRTAAAEAAIMQLAKRYMQLTARAAEDGVPFTREDDLRLNIVAREALTLAWTAMQEDVFRTAGTSAARNGERMERIFRDVAMDWGHFGNIVRDWSARELAREHLGLVAGPALKPDQVHTVEQVGQAGQT